MDKVVDVNKWLTGTGKSARWGIRILYLMSFGFYSYFMYFDTLFEGSRMPLILSVLAVFLVVPLVIFPTEWMQRFRIFLFAYKQQVQVDTISSGNKLAVTLNGELLKFIPGDKWRVKGTNATFATGKIEREVASKEALSIHKETQEHLAWSSVVFGEAGKLNFWFIAGNVFLYALPQVREVPGVTTDNQLIFLMVMTTALLLGTVAIRDGLTKRFFLGNKKFVVTTENDEGQNPQYAMFNTLHTDTVLAQVRGEGMTVQLEAVTLNGGLIYALSKDGVIVQHMTIERG